MTKKVENFLHVVYEKFILVENKFSTESFCETIIYILDSGNRISDI